MSTEKLHEEKQQRTWGISLDNTEFIQWNDDNELVILIPQKSKIEFLQEFIKEVSINDIVMGIKDQKFKKSGIIKNIYKTNVLRLIIVWEDEVLDDDIYFKFDLDDGGIISLPVYMLDANEFFDESESKKMAKPPVRSDNAMLGEEIHFATDDFNGNNYETVDNVMPESEEPVQLKEDPGGIVKLFYATNRKRVADSEVNERYNNERDDLKYGLCEVSIPKGHVEGELERPFSFWFVHLPENEEKHVVIKKADELEENNFFIELKNGVAAAQQHDALLFIHGYNTSFAEAARRTAQIAYDVPFFGITGFFSWPSAGELLGYLHDEANADWSVSHLETFIEKILTKTEVERFHILAHSMGNKILSFTLKNLANKSQLATKLKVIHQIVLGAPDIDRGIFEKDILPAIVNIGKRRTVYASGKDVALKASETVRMGLPRLGEAGEHIFVADGVDTIDASNVKSELKGHAYIFDTKELLSDLFYLFKDGKSPVDRRLRKRNWKQNLIYWLFPE